MIKHKPVKSFEVLCKSTKFKQFNDRWFLKDQYKSENQYETRQTYPVPIFNNVNS